MGETNKLISISIPESMYTWLENHKEINRAQEFREAITNKYITPIKQKVSPLVFFVSIMGIVFAIALIGIALTPTPMYITIRAVIPILAGVLAFMTALLYYKERIKVRTI